jgi:hypothetical protein
MREFLSLSYGVSLMCVQSDCEKNWARIVQQGDSSGLDNGFYVGKLVGFVNEELLHKKLTTCSELLNWETPVNSYIRQNGNGKTKLRKITQSLEQKEEELRER